VKVRYTPGSRKWRIFGPKPNGKGVHREVESAGSLRTVVRLAKSRTGGQKPHIRQHRADEPASQGEVRYYPNLRTKVHMRLLRDGV
jgi:hypothetical protein